MKKKISLITVLVLILLLAFTGCGKKDPTPDIQAVSTGFMDALVKGDPAETAKFVSPEMLAEGGDLESFGAADAFVESFIQGTGLGIDVSDLEEEGKAAIESFRTLLLENVVSGYELGDIIYEGDTATANVNISYTFDIDNLGGIDISVPLNELVTTFVDENYEELRSIMNSQGQEAFQLAVINGILPEFFEIYGQAVLESGGSTEDAVILLEKQDDNWIVTGLKSNNL